jgi:hypothetical protein
MWIGGEVLSLLGYRVLGLFPGRLLLVWGAVELDEMILAGLLDGRIYREGAAIMSH